MFKVIPLLTQHTCKIQLSLAILEKKMMLLRRFNVMMEVDKAF